jgi:hypothetical protein
MMCHMEDLQTQAQDVQPEGQGVPDVTPSAVQPEEGQGQPTTSLYDEALSSVPEEYREYVEPHFKKWDSTVNPKLQEFAEFRKRYEPYEDLTEYDPDSLRAMIEWSNGLDPEDPDTFREALLSLAASNGIDLLTTEDPDAEPADPVLSKLEELDQWRQQQEEERERQQFEQEEGTRLLNEWNEVQATHGKDFTEQEAETLRALATKFAATEDEPIKAAYEFITQLRGSAENDLVTKAPKQPAPAEAGGRADTTAKPVDDFDQALKLHLERGRQRITT